MKEVIGKNSTNKLKLFSLDAKFLLGASHKNQFPATNLPEFVFVGKSNVGKSSLINLLCNKHSLARVSKTPGRTREINFFLIANKLILVDLPGYGYSKTAVVTCKNWEKLILSYLENRKNLKLIYVLIDARRGIKDNDLAVINLVHHFNYTMKIVFTKEDKISDLEKNSLITTSKNLLDYNDKIIFTSIRNKNGAQEIQHNILKYSKRT
ncbi:ribosome biogenesis GTP-binding protein YihA/YsxC [Orientia tsutsugamushi]|uniref:Probable GTP-binding protein EngB n=1 Tax=Orientia tsutsugamushi str. TA716 TaxID=1359175 RepID=A0A0F3P886_ORITS|nr:ribosome biogenesis GTP-binding protein YihA/YsxC [Orientia tsutsugamushi]KJV76162.1 ribosome biogenesis GTP-binding protein YsxC [Orientia tsutsugamushi str. TA716]